MSDIISGSSQDVPKLDNRIIILLVDVYDLKYPSIVYKINAKLQEPYLKTQEGTPKVEEEQGDKEDKKTTKAITLTEDVDNFRFEFSLLEGTQELKVSQTTGPQETYLFRVDKTGICAIETTEGETTARYYGQEFQRVNKNGQDMILCDHTECLNREGEKADYDENEIRIIKDQFPESQLLEEALQEGASYSRRNLGDGFQLNFYKNNGNLYITSVTGLKSRKSEIYFSFESQDGKYYLQAYKKDPESKKRLKLYTFNHENDESFKRFLRRLMATGINWEKIYNNPTIKMDDALRSSLESILTGQKEGLGFRTRQGINMAVTASEVVFARRESSHILGDLVQPK